MGSECAFTEMIERVARAIAYSCDPEAYVRSDEDEREEVRETHFLGFIDPAKAAIEAMRQPTVDMVQAYDNADLAFVKSGYDALIDTALGK